MVMMNNDDVDDDGCHVDDHDDIDVYSINPSIKPRITVTVASKCYDY